MSALQKRKVTEVIHKIKAELQFAKLLSHVYCAGSCHSQHPSGQKQPLRPSLTKHQLFAKQGHAPDEFA